MDKKTWSLNNRKAINSTLFMNKGMIITFTIILFIVIAPLVVFTLVQHYPGYGIRTPWIASTSSNLVTEGQSNGDVFWTISNVLGMVLFSGPGLVFFIIIALFFINKFYIQEINSGKISLWLNLPLTRTNIIVSKILSIFIFQLIIFAPTYLMILGFTFAAADIKLWIGWFFLYTLQFLVFNFLIISVLVTFATFFTEKSLIINVCASLIILWILAAWVLEIINNFTAESFKILRYVAYFTPEILVYSPLKFEFNQDVIFSKWETSDGWVVTIKQSKQKNFIWWVSIIILATNIAVISSTLMLTIKKFNIKDLKV